MALVDADDDVVELDGILIYLGLFPEGSETPTNQVIDGSRFESTLDGLATFELTVTRKGKYRLRALTDDLPELGPHGPEPWLYSYVVRGQVAIRAHQLQALKPAARLGTQDERSADQR